MIVTELEFDAAAMVQSEADQAGLVRTPGLHLSQIYGDIERQWEAGNRREFSDRELAFYRAGGFLWEHAFSQALRQSLVTQDVSRPPELWCDGIIGSPDLINHRRWCPWDTKCTWKSARKLDSLERYFWPWLAQAKGYLKMMQTMGECREAELFVFFVNGDYSPPIPVIRHLVLEFEQREIDDNWQLMLRHARKKGWLQ